MNAWLHKNKLCIAVLVFFITKAFLKVLTTLHHVHTMPKKFDKFVLAFGFDFWTKAKS